MSNYEVIWSGKGDPDEYREDRWLAVLKFNNKYIIYVCLAHADALGVFSFYVYKGLISELLTLVSNSEFHPLSFIIKHYLDEQEFIFLNKTPQDMIDHFTSEITDLYDLRFENELKIKQLENK